MRLKFTPLLVVSICVITFGLSHLGGGGNLAPLIAILYVLPGILCLCFYFLLRAIFENKLWLQVGIEIILIAAIIIYIIYRSPLKNDVGKGPIVIELPAGYPGCVFLIYGVEGKPKLQSGSRGKMIHLSIPPSGILFTSDQRPYSYSNPFISYDSTQNPVKVLRPGYGIPFSMGTLICGNKKYLFDVFLFGNKGVLRDWVADTLKFKHDVICNSIK